MVEKSLAGIASGGQHKLYVKCPELKTASETKDLKDHALVETFKVSVSKTVVTGHTTGSRSSTLGANLVPINLSFFGNGSARVAAYKFLSEGKAVPTVTVLSKEMVEGKLETVDTYIFSDVQLVKYMHHYILSDGIGSGWDLIEAAFLATKMTVSSVQLASTGDNVGTEEFTFNFSEQSAAG